MVDVERPNSKDVNDDGYGIDVHIIGHKGADEPDRPNRCTLCGKGITDESGSCPPIVETVEGINCEFDSPECAIMFKRLRSVYGDRLNEVLGLEQFISDPFWTRVTPDEGEMIQMHNESQIGLRVQDVVRIIEEPDKIIRAAYDMIRSADNEVLILFSTVNAFKRQISIGGPELLREVTSLRKDLEIRILTPADYDVELSSVMLGTKLDKVNVRNMQAALQSKVTVLVVDRKLSLAVELKDDSQDDIYKALKSAVYSNSKSAAISYVAIFESLWKQVELIEQVSSLCKQLKDQQTDQREFITIAAHELRAPIQPILGLAEVLKSRHEVQMEKQNELLSVIIRNAKRLKELTENILDITRIENKSLELQREPIDIDEIVISVLNDALEESEPLKNVRLVYKHNRIKKFDSVLSRIYPSRSITFGSSDSYPDHTVTADRLRLTQVMTNLVGNAIKFSNDGGTVTVLVSEEKGTHNSRNHGKGERNQVLLVRVEDTGKGVDPEIVPKLFTKFASKSEKGMGLGLFISKNIVEAHGGKIWADIPKKEKGAVFSFTIPIE